MLKYIHSYIPCRRWVICWYLHPHLESFYSFSRLSLFFGCCLEFEWRQMSHGIRNFIRLEGTVKQHIGTFKILFRWKFNIWVELKMKGKKRDWKLSMFCFLLPWFFRVKNYTNLTFNGIEHGTLKSTLLSLLLLLSSFGFHNHAKAAWLTLK